MLLQQKLLCFKRMLNRQVTFLKKKTNTKNRNYININPVKKEKSVCRS